jgi:ribosome-binding ATPase YchF (GTP1/OBG family)
VDQQGIAPELQPQHAVLDWSFKIFSSAVGAAAAAAAAVELEAGRGARSATLNEDELLLVKGLGLLTLKPLIYAANVGEDDLGNHGANNVHVQVGGLVAAGSARRLRRAC